VPDVPPLVDDLVMRGLSAKVEDRFATAREMCVALGQCRVAEAPSIVVGEWVETLAADSLADRMAKVTAIESQPDSTAIAADTSQQRRAAAADAPTVVAGANRGRRVTSEPRSDLLSVTLTASTIRRSARARVLGVSVLLSAGLVLGIAALVRSVQHRSPPIAAVSQTRATEPPAVPSPLPDLSAVPSRNALSEEPLTPVPGVDMPAAHEAVPARSEAGSSRHVAPVVVRARPSASGQRAVDNPDRVFESRQ
jgi:hypothetical protein